MQDNRYSQRRIMCKVFNLVMLTLLSLLALSIAERRLDNAKELIEARDGHGEEHRPKKLFGKFKRPKSQYGPPKAHHQPKKPQYGPPPHVYGPPHPVGPPSQAYGHPKPVHPPPQANYQTPAYHPPQPVAYSRPGPTYSHPPKSSYGPPTYASPPQIVYNRPSPVYPKPAPSPPVNPVYNPPQPVYPQPVATYSQPAPAKPEVTYSPPAPSYGQVQVNHQPASYGSPDHDDSHEDDRKPSDDLPLTSVYNVPHSAHVELPTPTYGSVKPYEPAEPKPIVTPVFIKAELTGNRYQQSAEKLPETPVYKPPSSAYSSSQLEDDPPKQTEYNPKKPSYSDDTSDDLAAVEPSVTGSTGSSNYDDDGKFSPPNESDFPSLFDPSSNFYKQSENAPDTNEDSDFGFFQLGIFPKTSSFFEQNYKG